MGRFILGALLATCLVTVGCTTYYQVTDPTTGKRYYTTEYDQARDGAVSLTDERSGAEVTIQNSEIKELKQGAYEAAVAASEIAPVPAASPAAAPSPASAPSGETAASPESKMETENKSAPSDAK